MSAIHQLEQLDVLLFEMLRLMCDSSMKSKKNLCFLV